MNTSPIYQGSAYGHPSISFTSAPKLGQPDPHMAHVNVEVASMASVASDLLRQVVREELDIIGNPSSPAERRERAMARVLSAVAVVHSASNAVTSVAEAEAAHAGLVSPASLAEFKETSPGAADSPADMLSQFLNVKFNTARDSFLDAAGGMEGDPALADVLARRRQPGGVAGFFKRVSAAAVSLGALGSRALAIPGLVRQAVANGLNRADDAVQNAFDSWHAKFGNAVDSLRDEVGQRVDNVVSAVKGVGNWAHGKVHDAADATERGMDRAKQFAVDKIVTPAKDIGAAIAAPVVVGVATVSALDKVVTQRVTDSVKTFMTDRVAPAFERFASDVHAEIDTRTPDKYKSRISKDNFGYNEAAHAHLDQKSEISGPKGP